MPADLHQYRASIGLFVHTFVWFMTLRAKKAAAMFVRTIKIPVSVRPSDVLLFHLCCVFLLRAGDVERNPGPQSETVSLSCQMQSVLAIVTETSQQNVEIQRQMTANHRSVCTDMSDIKNQLNSVTRLVHVNTGHIQTLQQKLLQSQQRIEELQIELDKLESARRRNNLKLTGMREDVGVTFASLRAKVLVVLNEHVRDLSLTPDDLEEAVRVGRRREDYNRPVIVTLRRHETLMAIMADREGRQSMSRNGLRVGPDLSPSQQKEAQRLRAAGRRWFLKGGRVLPVVRQGHPLDPSHSNHREQTLFGEEEEDDFTIALDTVNATPNLQEQPQPVHPVLPDGTTEEDSAFPAVAAPDRRDEADLRSTHGEGVHLASSPGYQGARPKTYVHVGMASVTHPGPGPSPSPDVGDAACAAPLRGYGRGSPVGVGGGSHPSSPAGRGRAAAAGLCPGGGGVGVNDQPQHQYSPRQLRSRHTACPKTGGLNSSWKTVFARGPSAAARDSTADGGKASGRRGSR